MAAATLAAGMFAYEHGRGRLPDYDPFARPAAKAGDPLADTFAAPQASTPQAPKPPVKTF
jgi:hypothetical protein